MLSRLSPRGRALGYASGALLMAAMATGALVQLSPRPPPLILDPTNPRLSLTEVERYCPFHYPFADTNFCNLEWCVRSRPIVLL